MTTRTAQTLIAIAMGVLACLNGAGAAILGGLSVWMFYQARKP